MVNLPVQKHPKFSLSSTVTDHYLCGISQKLLTTVMKGGMYHDS